MTSTLSINLNTLSNNLQKVKHTIGTDVKICLVVKANAYGLGASYISKYVKDKVDYLAVATVTEGKSLRRHGVETPILLLSEAPEYLVADIALYNLTATLYSQNYADILNESGYNRNKHIPVHIKVDTGMHRLGCQASCLNSLVRYVSHKKNLIYEGLFSHMSQSGINKKYTQRQINVMSELVQSEQKNNQRPKYVHFANSGGIGMAGAHFDMVRIGLSAYHDIAIFESYISHVQTLRKGSVVGYEAKYICSENETIAIIPTGYADGIPIFKKQAYVLIGGEKYPIVGSICMDMMMVSLGDNKYAFDNGEKVVLLGNQVSEQINIQDWQAATGLNPRTLLCGFGERVTRVYM